MITMAAAAPAANFDKEQKKAVGGSNLPDVLETGSPDQKAPSGQMRCYRALPDQLPRRSLPGEEGQLFNGHAVGAAATWPGPGNQPNGNCYNCTVKCS